MLDWLATLPLLGKLWLGYAAAVALLFALAAHVEYSRSRPVDGAGGWLLFGAFALSLWGLGLTVLASLAIVLVRWLA